MLILNLAGAGIASVVILSPHDVAGYVRAPGLRWAWWGLTLLLLCCIGLLLAAAAASIGRTLGGSDFAETGIHILGPLFLLGAAWLSRRTARDMLRIETLE